MILSSMANNNSQNFNQRLIPTYQGGNINNKFSCYHPTSWNIQRLKKKKEEEDIRLYIFKIKKKKNLKAMVECVLLL